MAIEIKRVYKEHMPAIRFIGKRYTNEDRKNGNFGIYWEEWRQKGWWHELAKVQETENMDNYIGLMGCDEKGNGFQYWIGWMFPQNTSVPENFSYVDIPESDVGICWIYGKAENGEIYGEGPHNLCLKKLKENGMNNEGKESKWSWFIERYNEERFMKKDENGNVILDYGVYLGKE
jgi:predicted transcriptional regulator YdeE